MTVVFIVDQDATGLAVDLNAFATGEGHRVEFQPFTTVNRMFDVLKERTPDLVLLHHHWEGLTIAQVLQRIGDTCADTRVVVFTGQALNIRELIESVRFGVADYWPERGTLEPQWIFTKIAHYCSSSAWTVRMLRMPSGSLEKLLHESLARAEQASQLEDSTLTLKARVTELESNERQQLMSGGIALVTLAGTAVILAGVFLLVDLTTDLSSEWSFAFVSMVGLLLVIREGKLAKALIRWGRTIIKLESK